MNITTDRRSVPPVFHAFGLALVAWCVWMAQQRPAAYVAAMQEDRGVEWATVWFFAAAGAIGLARAVKRRRVFDGLVALFCLVFAGEEMSWGQRLLGVTPPAYFLEHNTQQELNIHNFGGVFGSPKWPFVVILVGYAVVLPLVALTPIGRRVLDRIGASIPAPATIPWFVAAIAFLVWYPFRFTGEWVELLAGATFFASMGVTTRSLLTTSAGGAVFALAFAAWSARGSASASQLACAQSETHAVAEALRVAAGDMLETSLHKRAWTLIEEGYVDEAVIARGLATAHCASGDAPTRRRYAVDPWGTAYWVRVRPSRDSTILIVYSFGPNHRRDNYDGARNVGDDILARMIVSGH